LYQEIINTALLVLLIFIAGALVIISAAYLKKNTNLFAELWRLYGIEVFIVAAVLIPAYFGGLFFLAILLLFNLRAHVEIAHLHGYDQKIVVITAGILLSSILITTGFYVLPDNMSFVFLVISAVLSGLTVSLVLLAWDEQKYIPALLPMIIIMLSIYCLLRIRTMDNGFLLILFLYIITETNDSFALVFGKLFGKRKLCPAISPNKTWEGMVSGVITAFVAGMAFAHYILHMQISYAGMIIGLIIASAIIGDLVFSIYKRVYKRKDFKTLIEGHGGILDIYDSVLISSPIFYILILITGLSYSLESTILP